MHGKAWLPLAVLSALLAWAGEAAAAVAPGELTAYVRERGYEQYLSPHAGAPRPALEIDVPATGYTGADRPPEILSGLGGTAERAVLSREKGYIEWTVRVPQAGLYNIAVRYCLFDSGVSAAEREIWINGARPFAEAKYLEFHRVWVDLGKALKDRLGNEIRPRQVQKAIWQETLLSDAVGFIQEPFQFYLQAGQNTIRLIGADGSMAVALLKIFNPPPIPAYREAEKAYRRLGCRPAQDFSLEIQGQDATYKSDSTLFPISEQGDPTAEPYHPYLLRLNAIGGYRWAQVGQWIAWDFSVPADGLYKIAIKAKQDQRVGNFSNRRILIDGKVPFAELKAVKFPYSDRYRLTVLGGGDDRPYLFYLTKGRHQIRLEVVLGDLARILKETEDCLYELNTIYRRIVMVTSNTPDPIRSYELDKKIPAVIKSMAGQSVRLARMAADFEAVTGLKGGHTETLLNLARLLSRISANPDLIPASLGEFSDDKSALGTWITRTKDQPLQIDYIVVASPGRKLPRPDPTIFQIALHEVRAFLASFFFRYDLVGEMKQPARGRDERLKVWIASGRDQFLTLKRMVEDSFTPETGIPVNLQLVQNMGSLLIQATIAGTGPDVALGVAENTPINYAFRGAVANLAKFPDFQDVAKRFKKAAFVPYRFRDSVYALPEQQSFPMLFYRRDILAEFGLEVPQTWDDIYKILPVLQRQNMTIGIGSGIYQTMLYQKGGVFYKEDGLGANLDSEIAVQTFTELTNLFNLYGLLLKYDALNRFREGVMPLIIEDYGFFNRLSVFAPELRGEWGLALIPGLRQPDGTIRRVVASVGAVDNAQIGGPAVVLMERSRRKEAGWQFMKWWTRADIQARFGQEIEAMLGSAARYPTANVEAFKQLPWSAEARELLLEQWDWVEGIPEVPGSYYANRMFDWAFRAVTIQYQPVRETCRIYNYNINKEVMAKRREFGLETDPAKLPERWKRAYWDHFTHLKPPGGGI